MTDLKAKILIALCLSLISALSSQIGFAQNSSKPADPEKPKAHLVHKFNAERVTLEMADLYVDMLRNEVFFDHPGSTARIIFYCGRVCHNGEFNAHVSGIRNTLKYKRLDKTKFSVVFGGFREEPVTEFWLVPVNAEYPTPAPTVEKEMVTFRGSYKNKVIIYHYEDGF